MANIIRWNPIREMAAMQSLMDRMFDDLAKGNAANEFTGSALALDVHEDDTGFTVSTALPGVDADNIKINLHDDMLHIEAEIPERKIEKQGSRTLMQERTYGKFSRAIRLPVNVNADKVEANFENGVLTLILPKSENAQPRQISVRKSNGQGSNN
jgi:HSP20 family protein